MSPAKKNQRFQISFPSRFSLTLCKKKKKSNLNIMYINKIKGKQQNYRRIFCFRNKVTRAFLKSKKESAHIILSVCVIFYEDIGTKKREEGQENGV